MNPATIALFSTAISEALRLGLHLADVIKRANEGSLTEEAALAELAKASADFNTERAKMDQAIADARVRAKGNEDAV